MRLDLLKEAEKSFLSKYPGGFSHPEMQRIAKRHKKDKMHELAVYYFSLEKMKDPKEITDNFASLIAKSSLVSIFDKAKFRDFIKEITVFDRNILADGLIDLLHGDMENGYRMVVDVLKKGKMAKWSIVSLIPYYFRPEEEVFLKPTTVKGILKKYEIEELAYKPEPYYEFYEGFKKVIHKMKNETDGRIASDNAAFTGFLMMTMED